MEDRMKLPRIRLSTIAFGIVILAVDFAILRAAFSNFSEDALAVPMLLLLPMIDGLLIAVYQLRRPSRRTARAVGFLAGGVLGTGALIAGFLVSADSMLLLLRLVGRPMFEATRTGLTSWLGNATMQAWPMRLALGIGFEFLFPVTFYCLLALAAALGGAWLAGRLRPVRLPAEVLPDFGGCT
jgi:hypothetical protein